MRAIEIAKICHEANRAYCQVLGDDSQVPWKDLPDWQQRSAENLVNYHIANPDKPFNESFFELPETQRLRDTLFATIVEACNRYS